MKVESDLIGKEDDKSNLEKKMEWTKRMNLAGVKPETETINEEQEKVVQKLKQIVNFLEHTQIKNEESLAYISKPVDDLLSSLKYLPLDPSFDDIPVEIKTDILDYLCDSGAFVAASVCQEWKMILKKRLENLEYVKIGKCCSTFDGPGCEDRKCFMPEAILNASIALKMDVPLRICYPVTNVNAKLLADGLTSVSQFKIVNDCYCREEDDDYEDRPILTDNQTTHLFEALEQVTRLDGNHMEEVELKGLDMTHLDQERLIKCLLNINSLSLAQGCFSDWIDEDVDWIAPILNVEILIEKLWFRSFNLSYLHLEYLEYPPECAVKLAHALCRVEAVSLGPYFPLQRVTAKHLARNILALPIKLKNLSIRRSIDWRALLTPKELKDLITKIATLQMWGVFTTEQVEAAWSLDGVEATEITCRGNDLTFVKILKGYE